MIHYFLFGNLAIGEYSRNGVTGRLKAIQHGLLRWEEGKDELGTLLDKCAEWGGWALMEKAHFEELMG